ncbi:GTP-binding protein Obg/CgtA [Hypoxylon trugodes]|uniref:GTP-binding protein Obg/CgtA n=1 Tax=Hypoxylon trugodes TaxID=326681 RepID=UPI00218DB2E2|nr:GTP-binding protein Obg/CgtA [Hypoxylon trugodes]KAI1386310.1 GTP-binding protein Obg/CgtA [Hypoxylon trugodes]
MPPRCSPGSGLFLPFLYPSFFRSTPRAIGRAGITVTRHSSTSSAPDPTTRTNPSTSSSSLPHSRLNPAPDDYAISTFADKARMTVHAGGGGHGCISFLREAYLADGPANGGDGGHGGNVYVQAVRGETSLHKLARRRILRAGRGKAGQGSSRGGARGDDVVIQVPVGTVVRELGRMDPVIGERARFLEARAKEREYERLVKERELEAEASVEDVEEERERGEAMIQSDLPEPPPHPNQHKFLLYPGITNNDRRTLTFPRLPLRERLYVQPEAPIHLDLSEPTLRPILIAAGGIGGLGNPHFVSKDRPRPLFATKGEAAVSLQLELELKLLADVGLVGLPNAGKSTLLRALTNSRARVGNWAFTTLQPNIGTVVLDNHKGRPIPVPKPSRSAPQHAVIHDATYGSVVLSRNTDMNTGVGGTDYEARQRFTVADIPGLIEGAHLDRGLGIEFLRHVERAGVLAFVVDLGAGDAVAALKALWAEVGLYARMREEEEQEREVGSRIDWEGDGSNTGGFGGQQMIVAHLVGQPVDKNEGGLYIAAKPWFVIATKGDLPGTEDNYAQLKEYLDAVTQGREPHPSGVENAWVEDCAAIPVSAINGHGVERIIHWTVGLLDGGL